jgi:hypothetical protein
LLPELSALQQAARELLLQQQQAPERQQQQLEECPLPLPPLHQLPQAQQHPQSSYPSPEAQPERP